MVTWIQKLQLTIDDPVFAGLEAAQMRRVLAGHAVADHCACAASAPPTSLQQQAVLAEELNQRGQSAKAMAIADGGLDRFGVAGQAVLSSHTLRSAIAVMNAFAPLLNLRHGLVLSFRNDEAIISFHDLIDLIPERRRSILSLDIIKLSRFINDFTSDSVTKPLADAVAGVTVVGDRLHLPASLINQERLTVARSDNQAHQRACRQIMAGLAEHALRESVRRLVLKGGETPPSLSVAAAQLGLSTRTFRRRLAEQGTTFMQIRDATRYALAVRYLSTTRMTTELIAQRLGYSESANFRQAFRRWTGSSPRYYAPAVPAGDRMQAAK